MPAEHVDTRAELAHRAVDLPAAVAQHDVVRRVAELGPVAPGVAQQSRQAQERATGAAVLSSPILLLSVTESMFCVLTGSFCLCLVYERFHDREEVLKKKIICV